MSGGGLTDAERDSLLGHRLELAYANMHSDWAQDIVFAAVERIVATRHDRHAEDSQDVLAAAVAAERERITAAVEAVLADPPFFIGIQRRPLVPVATIRAALTEQAPR